MFSFSILLFLAVPNQYKMFVHINKSLRQTLEFRQVKNASCELEIVFGVGYKWKFDINHHRNTNN